MRTHPLFGSALALTLLLLSSTSDAIITQINGAVLPQTQGNMQAGLDIGEGTANLLNAVFDAAVVPEVFQVPQDNGIYRTVTFADILEGAGYENTFGWYNVSDPSTFYPVLTCAPATNHEPGDSVQVDFQAEFNAGHYKGGFIGFFLVSPGATLSPNCGNPANLNVNATTFAVRTEAALNGDGNYVHYLIYESKAHPLTYYFGFEDLWRGGDNDFEDMLIRVTGLLKPCTPSPEICDGLDNNCDGEIDNNTVDSNVPCYSFQPASTADVGECHSGLLQCQAATLVCVGDVGPQPEICDKKDNDCDGTIDNNPTDVNQSCGTTEEGECAFGTTGCVAGVKVCLGAVGPAPEVCDKKDNDCNGQVDDSPIDAIGNCPITGSTCPGVRVCVDGAIQCQPTSSGTNEVCNGADDNCNGLVDEGDPGGGADCVPEGVKTDPQGKPLGTCLLGKQHCIGGMLKCLGGRGPTPEVCDGLDNDCDGVSDQQALCPGDTACVEGKCADPCGSGEFPCPGGKMCVKGYCVSIGDAGVGGAGGAGPDGGNKDGSADASGHGGSAAASTDASSAGSAAAPQQNNNWGLTTGGGGSSCSLRPNPRSPASFAALLVGLGVVALGLRRRRITFAGLAASIAGLLTQACSEEPYCFDCESKTDGAAATGGQAGSGAGGNAGDSGLIVVDGSAGTTQCGDTKKDPLNCGTCGNKCNVPNAFPKCDNGFCIIDKCATDYFDIDGKASNGCEYDCVPVLDQNSKPVTEEVACDGKDDDCDGQIDELYDTTSNPQHCGKCGNVCEIPGATAKCVAGKCEFDHCLQGYEDKNQDPSDGCECNSMGIELCNNLDDDCDSSVDEGFDLTTDPKNCGACNHVCGNVYPHAKTACVASVCQFNGCDDGYFDYDGELLNGCEYACTPTSPPTEICDGQDNDCDGFADNGVLPQVGDACGVAIGECKEGVNQCVNGQIVCSNAVGPTTEVCDDKDNDCNGSPDEGCPSAGPTDSRLDLASTINQYACSQLHVASEGNNVFVAFLERRANSDIHFVASTDSGANWTSDVVAAGDAADEVEPWVFASPSSVYVAHERFGGGVRRIYLSRSQAPYSSFTVPLRVDKIQDAATDAFLLRGVVAQAGGADTLVLVWQVLTGTNRDIYLQASTNAGASWLASDLRVNSVPGSAESPAIATNGAGNVYIAWRDNRNGHAEVFASTFNATTATLSPNVALSGGQESKPPVLAADNAGNVHVAWTDLRGAKKAIRVNSSTDGGATFKPDGVLVNVDSTFADADAPAIAARTGQVAVAWEDTRSGLTDIRVNSSADSGVTWKTTCARVDGGTAGTFASRRPAITLGANNFAFVAWEENRIAGKTRDIYANHSINGGATFQPKDLRLDVGGAAPASAPSPAGEADSYAPFVVAPVKNAIVVWLDGRTAAGANAQNADVYANTVLLP